MEKNVNNEKISHIFYISLLLVTCALVLLLAIGTIIGLVRPQHAQPLITFGSAAYAEQTNQTEDVRVFSGLGRLRIPLVNSSTMLLSIAFPYSVNDVPFTEELASKIGDFRGIAAGYFSALPAEALIQIDEDTAKQEILRRFNENLRLGRITTLYFSDMIVLDAGATL
jgi:flagellar basal body-associated protein FliL